MPTGRAAAGGVSHEPLGMQERGKDGPPPDAMMLAMLDVCRAVANRAGRDLTARQLAGFLLIYTSTTTHTVHTLAAEMNILPSSVRSVMDRLAQLGLIVRERNCQDHRCILARPTAGGAAFFQKVNPAGKLPDAAQRDRSSVIRSADDAMLTTD